MRQNTGAIILIAEDNDADFETAKRAFQKSNLSIRLVRCLDGDETIDYLSAKGKYSDTMSYPKPDIVLLDLNLPGTDGREVLEVVKQDHELRKTPIIILTTSSDERDIKRCYDYGANSYIQKPVDFSCFLKTIGRLQNYWLTAVTLPNDAC